MDVFNWILFKKGSKDKGSYLVQQKKNHGLVSYMPSGKELELCYGILLRLKTVVEHHQPHHHPLPLLLLDPPVVLLVLTTT
jgi:hypothetical protein